jgi:hypothetical protein
VTGLLQSGSSSVYCAVMQSIHSTEQYENNRAEQSHEANRASDEAVQIGGPGSEIFGCSSCGK